MKRSWGASSPTVYTDQYTSNKGTYTGRPLEVLAGNHTLEAMRRLAEQNPEDPRWQTVDVWEVDVDDQRAAKIVLTESLAVVDEFTSVVDRQVAKVTSHCVQKSLRRGTTKFVAVTCHYDVEDWLQPDWVYDAASQEFRWRSVQPRPQLTLNIREAKRSEWTLFAHHHYMSPVLASSAKCFIAEIDGKPVAWTSYIHFMHPRTKNIKMEHRTVVLPDYQGLGIAGALADWQGQRLYEMGYRYRKVLAHPAMVRIAQKSPRWRQTAAPAKRVATSAKSQNKKGNMSARRLMLHIFEYVPPVGTKNPRRKPMDRAPKKKVKRPTRK